MDCKIVFILKKQYKKVLFMIKDAGRLPGFCMITKELELLKTLGAFMKINSLGRFFGLFIFLLLVFSGCAQKDTPARVETTQPGLRAEQKKCLRVLWVANSNLAKVVEKGLEQGGDFVDLCHTMTRANPDKVTDRTYCLHLSDMEPSLRLAALGMKLGATRGPLSLNQGHAWIRATTDRHFRQAAGFFRQNRFLEAQDALAKDLELNPDHIAGWRLQSMIMVGKRDWPGALEAVDKALYWAPLDPVLITNKASFLWKMGQKEKAIVFYEKAVGLNPANPKMLNNLAWALAAQRTDLDRALSLAQRATGLSPYAPNLWNTLGWIQKLKGDHAGAVVSLQKSLHLGNTNPETQKWLLESFLSLNRDQLAGLEDYLLARGPKLVLNQQKPLKQAGEGKKSLKPAPPEKSKENKEVPKSEQQVSTPPPWILAKKSVEISAPKPERSLTGKNETGLKKKDPLTSEKTVSSPKLPTELEKVENKSGLKDDLPPKKTPKTTIKESTAAEFKVASLPEKISEKSIVEQKADPLPPANESLPKIEAVEKKEILPREEPPRDSNKRDAKKKAPLSQVEQGEPQEKVFRASLDRGEDLAGNAVATPAAPKNKSRNAHGPYLQIASFRNLNDALSARRVWQRKGADCLLEHLDLGSRGKWYRVLLGPFVSYEKARNKGRALQKNGEIKTFMVVEK